MRAAPKSPIIVAGALLFGLGARTLAEENRVAFPEDLAALTHFTTVTRGEVTEHKLTSEAAIEAAQNGEPIPYGTQVILADYRDGALYRLFVMEKGEGWGRDYDDGRTDDWQFQWFWPDGSGNMDENTQRCRSCHASRGASNEFMYTFRDLMSFRS